MELLLLAGVILGRGLAALRRDPGRNLGQGGRQRDAGAAGGCGLRLI